MTWVHFQVAAPCMPHSLPPGVLLAFDFLQIISSEKDTAFEGPGMRSYSITIHWRDSHGTGKLWAVNVGGNGGGRKSQKKWTIFEPNLPDQVGTLLDRSRFLSPYFEK